MRPSIPTSDACSDSGTYAAGLQGEQARNAGDAYRAGAPTYDAADNVIANNNSGGARYFAAAVPQGCTGAQIVKPVPFLGTAEEVVVLSDGSVWKDLSYKYLYLYAYSPAVRICAAQSKMILEHGGATHTFSLMRLK